MKVKAGIEEFDISLKKGKTGLFSNISGVNEHWERSVDIIRPDYIFTGEHGYFEEFAEGEKFSSYKDPINQTKIVSLYGEDGKEALSEIDTLFIDIQDVSVRCFTYASTLLNLIKTGKGFAYKIIVLDRPNLQQGKSFGGPAERTSFVAPPFIPFVYPFTLGELALFYSAKFDGDVSVIKLKNYKREMNFYDTAMAFSSPSPNLPDIQAVMLYPGLVLMEEFNVSVGRGTQKPFRIVGAPFIDAGKLTTFVKNLKIDGLLAKPAVFTPSSGKFAKEKCYGSEFYVENPSAFEPMRLGFHLVEFMLKSKVPFEKRENNVYGTNFAEKVEKYGAENFYAKEKTKGDEFIKNVGYKYFIY